jgi:hypothetical protein
VFPKQNVLFGEHRRNPASCFLDTSGIAVVEFNHFDESLVAARQPSYGR